MSLQTKYEADKIRFSQSESSRNMWSRQIWVSFHTSPWRKKTGSSFCMRRETKVRLQILKENEADTGRYDHVLFTSWMTWNVWNNELAGFTIFPARWHISFTCRQHDCLSNNAAPGNDSFLPLFLPQFYQNSHGTWIIWTCLYFLRTRTAVICFQEGHHLFSKDLREEEL